MRWGIPANTSPPTALPISPPFGSSSTGKTEFASQASGGDPPLTSSRCRLGISTATRRLEPWSTRGRTPTRRLRPPIGFSASGSPDWAAVDRFTREIAPLILNGPPSVTGFAGGRPKPEEIVAYWPALLDKGMVEPCVEVVDV